MMTMAMVRFSHDIGQVYGYNDKLLVLLEAILHKVAHVFHTRHYTPYASHGTRAAGGQPALGRTHVTYPAHHGHDAHNTCDMLYVIPPTLSPSLPRSFTHCSYRCHVCCVRRA